jgi:hypothetical protein
LHKWSVHHYLKFKTQNRYKFLSTYGGIGRQFFSQLGAKHEHI